MSEIDLLSIKTATERADICAQAETRQAEPSYIVERDSSAQESLQKHYLQLIVKFCDESNIEATVAAQGETVLPIDAIITSSVLDEWQSLLESKGYVITRDGYDFRISVA
jgi:hypothetical protein